MEKEQWRHILLSGMHRRNAISQLFGGETESLLRYFRFKKAAKTSTVAEQVVNLQAYETLFRGRDEWRQRTFVAVFLLLFFLAFFALLSQHFLSLIISYISLSCELFLYKIWWDLVGNFVRIERVSNSNTLSIQGVQFKSRPGTCTGNISDNLP